MNILDNKKKFKDTIESYANNIFKFKLSNKPNKFNAASNDLKKEYKKLTKLRKDINDIIENNPNDSRLTYINQSAPLMHETIEKYEEVLVENGEPIMEQPNSSSNKDSQTPSQSASQPILNDADAIRASKKEQRRLMKEKKNKMKLQAKLAQQEAFNNKQIMITEKSAKDIVIEIPTEPSTPTKTSEEPDLESLRVEAVPKVKKNEDKKKKKDKHINGTVVYEKNISNVGSSLNKPATSGSSYFDKILGINSVPTTPLSSAGSQATNTTSSPAPAQPAPAPKTVEWSELATQRKLKEQEEKQKEERLKFEQEKMKKQLEDREKYLKDKFTVPSVFMKLELPQNTTKTFEPIESEVEKSSVKYTIEKDSVEMKYDNNGTMEQYNKITAFRNKIDQTHPELPDSLKQMFTDLHIVRNSSYKSLYNPEDKPTWFNFKESQDFVNIEPPVETPASNTTTNNTSSQGIVITGRRQDKDNGTDEKEKIKEEKGKNFELGFSFTHGLISNIFEQCVNKDM